MTKNFDRAGVSAAELQAATADCVQLRVKEIVEETHDARSFVLELPDGIAERFTYQPGQFLSFKIPFNGHVLTRSYSLSSSPHTDLGHKVTVKRIDDGRISNWMNDQIEVGSTLMVVPPAGLFVLNESDEKLVLFAGGSGITPVLSIIKSALATTQRSITLIYANRDERSIIFKAELESLAATYSGRIEVHHSLDDVGGFLDRAAVMRHVGDGVHSDFYLCGPGPFMAIVEEALGELQVDASRIHIERFASPLDSGSKLDEVRPEVSDDSVPAEITIVLNGQSREVPYRKGELILLAARTAGLDPPSSCEEGFCSCCKAKLTAGKVTMDASNCLSENQRAAGWILTCQARCSSGKVKVEYPDPD